MPLAETVVPKRSDSRAMQMPTTTTMKQSPSSDEPQNKKQKAQEAQGQSTATAGGGLSKSPEQQGLNTMLDKHDGVHFAGA